MVTNLIYFSAKSKDGDFLSLLGDHLKKNSITIFNNILYLLRGTRMGNLKFVGKNRIRVRGIMHVRNKDSHQIHSEKRKTHYILNNCFSFFIYLSTFFLFYYLKKHTLILDNNYYQLLGLLGFSLIVGSILSNKFILTVYHEVWQIFRKLCISIIFSLGFLSILLKIFEVSNISRGVLIGTMFSGLMIETFYYFLISDKRKKINIVKRITPSINYLIIDGAILSIFCYSEIIFELNFNNLMEKHLIMLIVIYLSWILSAGTTHKFQPEIIARSKWEAFGLHVKFYLLIISLVMLSIFLLQIKTPDWNYFVEAIAKYSVFSAFLALIVFAKKIRNKTDEASTSFLRHYELKESSGSILSNKSEIKYSISDTIGRESNVKQKFQFEYLREYKNIFNFLERKLNLKSFDINYTHVFRSEDFNSVRVLPYESMQLIMNLHIINDQLQINNHLHEINSKLLVGGIYVGSMMDINNRYSRFLIKYPYLLANILYLADFIWKRVFPKLPVTNKIYSSLSNGKDRALSLAEILGRLIYCGFEILDLSAIDNQVFFVAKKNNSTNQENNGNYSPIFKMKRIGQGDKTFFVYKLRTMHPYSELIQDFVYLNNKIHDSGKFNNDFRIPFWGKFLRSIWLDELPMIFNLFRGDIKLVGVRPLSCQYLSLYSEQHQERRKRFKPGLVPPYYAHMPKTIKGIELSEQKYFDDYEKDPIKTDFKYFFMALKNILFQEIRSA